MKPRFHCFGWLIPSLVIILSTRTFAQAPKTSSDPITLEGDFEFGYFHEHARVPAGYLSGEPNLATGADGRIYLTWIERGRGMEDRFSLSVLDGRGWSEPREIAAGKNWFVNWADFPTFAVNKSGSMMATWLEKLGVDTYAYGVRARHSSDSGHTWSNPFWIHHDGTETEHGFVSIVPGPNGVFDVLWLDGREMVRDGPMTLRHARIDQNGNVTEQYVVDTRVCDCCQTSAVRSEDNSLLVVYRDRNDVEVRDISIARFDGQSWSTPRTVHADGWQIAGCPVNGPAIDAVGSRVAVVWYTGADSSAPAVYLAQSRDGGESFGKPTRLDQGNPLGRVDIAIASREITFVSWLEQIGDTAFVLVDIIGSGLPDMPPQKVVATSIKRESGFPRLTCNSDQVVVAWTDPVEKRVRTAFLSLGY